MSVFMAAFLGIVQGITEFLPVSSSGHLSILKNFCRLDYSESDHLLFEVLLHLATLVSVVIVYRKDIRAIIADTAEFLRSRGEVADEEGRLSPNVRTLLLIIVATLPLFVMVPFSDKIELLNARSWFIGFALLVTGTLVFVADRLREGRKSERTTRLTDALIVGIGQALAVIPGLSRSGTTITLGVARGLKRDFAMKFSFLLSIPAILGSVLLQLVKALSAGTNWSLFPVYLVGMVFAGVTGYFALRLLKLLIDRSRFGKIAYYCWAIGALTLILSIFIH